MIFRVKLLDENEEPYEVEIDGSAVPGSRIIAKQEEIIKRAYKQAKIETGKDFNDWEWIS